MLTSTISTAPMPSRCARGRRWWPRPSRPVACALSGVPEEQLLIVTGGETVQCGPTTRVRVLPALHSCLFAHSDADTGIPCLGDLDISAQDRAATVRTLFSAMDAAPAPAGPALVAMNEVCSRHDGGQLAYLLMTSGGLSAGERQRGLLAGPLRRACGPTSRCSPSGVGPMWTANPSRAPPSTSCSSRCSASAPGGSPSATTTRCSPGCPGVDIGPAAAALQAPGAPAGYFELEYATPLPILG